MPKYADDSAEWGDVVPIPQDEGSENPLAAIAYPEDYSEAMSYLRAVMADNESSDRALSLTEDIIRMNPAHYTVWLYRCKVLFALDKDLRKELEWVNQLALKNLKNYQIWHHRQTIVEKLQLYEGETKFIDAMLEKDAKNYHVWSYRQWLVKRFDLYNKEELDFVDRMLEDDVRNNSAWNHRWFVIFGKDTTKATSDADLLQREVEYAKEKIRQAPQNQSPWNYLRGIYRESDHPISRLKPFAEEFARLGEPDEVTSSHALDLLAHIYAESKHNDEAAEALELLAVRFDPIRANYWQYRKALLAEPTAA